MARSLSRFAPRHLKPVDKQMASGSHYASAQALPVICGTDGVGRFADGQRVFFGGTRVPYGAMAGRTVVRKAFVFPVPDALDDYTAAAIRNPGVSAWLSLNSCRTRTRRKRSDPGSNRSHRQTRDQNSQAAGCRARRGGRQKSRDIRCSEGSGSGRHRPLDVSAPELTRAFTREAGQAGFQVVIDYVWGPVAEAFFAAVTRKEFAAITTETRYV